MSGSFVGGISRNFHVLSRINTSYVYRCPPFCFKSAVCLGNKKLSVSSFNLSEKSKLPGSESEGNGVIDPDGYSLDLDEKSQQKLNKFKTIIEKNSYYEKYKAKIVNTQKSSPKFFSGMIEQLVYAGRKAAGYSQLKKSHAAAKYSLDEVMRLEMLLKVDREDIVFIWQEYHHALNILAATTNGHMYEKICRHGKSFPTFVLPLPKNDGYEMFLVQYSGGSFYFTPMIKYQKYKENAPVCLSLIHYTELRSDKDLVLMRGEWDKDSITLMEAQFLTVQLNLYFGEGDDQRLDILKIFNENPKDFDHMLVILELQRMKIEYPHLFPELK